jgi:hypothetical protein
VLEAIDRGLVPPGVEIVLHGSGGYTGDDYVTADAYTEVSTVEEIAATVLGSR